MILEKGSTLEEAAESLHKDFYQNLKYAVVWGSGKYDGQRVSKDMYFKRRHSRVSYLDFTVIL